MIFREQLIPQITEETQQEHVHNLFEMKILRDHVLVTCSLFGGF